MSHKSQFGRLPTQHNHMAPHYVYQGFGPGEEPYEDVEGSSASAPSAGDSNFAFSTGHQSQSELAASPSSSYAPSLSEGRNNSIGYGQPPQFKMPDPISQDRRTSSPNVIAMPQQMMPPSQYQVPVGQQEMNASFWTPNFSFGDPSQNAAVGQPAGHTAPGYTAPNYPRVPREMIPIERRGSHGSYAYAGNPQNFPAHFNPDRRMSHPVLPSGSFNSSADVGRQRQASAVDWRSYTAKNDTARQRYVGPMPEFQGQNALWSTIDPARGMVAVPHQNPDPSLNLYTQGLASRRQSMPYSNVKSMLDEDGSSLDGSSLFHGANMQLSGSDEGSIIMQPSVALDNTPDQASMMNTFSAKDSSSGHKKHVCHICKKRFTRPSSLATHIYSHTGQKPFKCDIGGCSKEFSVISNLRRHKKIHDQADLNASKQVATQPAA